jgi:hypothetical protein
MVHKISRDLATSSEYKPQPRGANPPKNTIAPSEEYSMAASLELSCENKTPIRNLAHKELEGFIGESIDPHQDLASLVTKLISRQGEMVKTLLERPEGLLINAELPLETSKVLVAKGEWSVENLSQRLLALARAAARDDKNKIPELKKAISRGFKEAEKTLGNQLPEICHQSYHAVIKGLDQWADNKTRCEHAKQHHFPFFAYLTGHDSPGKVRRLIFLALTATCLVLRLILKIASATAR